MFSSRIGGMVTHASGRDLVLEVFNIELVRLVYYQKKLASWKLRNLLF